MLRCLPWLPLVALLAGCATERSAAAVLTPRGPLAAFLEPPLASLSPCTMSIRQYVRPFWRAPYRECRDSLPGGWQYVEVDADTVVTEATRSWDVTEAEAAAAFAREAARLTAAFGVPADSTLAPSAKRPIELRFGHWRTHCAGWQGPDSVQASLRLTPLRDSPRDSTPVVWRLTRSVRNGPLPDAVACRVGVAAP